MQQQIITQNILINYLVKPGQQGPLLFLHGWRSEAAVWQSVIENNKLSNYQIYALDFPGFGRSQTPKKEFTVGNYAEFVVEFIKKLELQNVIIVGHSFGGRVGIKLTSTCPELIGKLVLVDSAGFAYEQSKKKIMGFGAKLVKPLFKPQFMQGLRKKIYQNIGAEDYLATPGLQKTFLNIVSEDLSADMKNISCPTLIINGENDKDTPVEFGQRMNSLIRNSQFTILSKAGHFSFLDKPEEFIKILSNFVSS